VASDHEPVQVGPDRLERQPELLVVRGGVHEVMSAQVLPNHVVLHESPEPTVIDADRVSLRLAIEFAEEVGLGDLGQEF